MTRHATAQALGALGVCAAVTVCALYVTKSTAQNANEGRPAASNASPIYGITIPAGYRDWRLISVAHLAGGSLKQLRAQLGNDIAIKAFRKGSSRSRTAQSLPRCIGMKPRRTKTTKSWPAAFPAPASNLPLPPPPRMFSSWSRTRKSTPRPTAGDLPTSRTANLATRRCTRRATPATSLRKIATSSSPVTRPPPERTRRFLAESIFWTPHDAPRVLEACRSPPLQR